jgi:hypothetical protein
MAVVDNSHKKETGPCDWVSDASKNTGAVDIMSTAASHRQMLKEAGIMNTLDCMALRTVNTAKLMKSADIGSMLDITAFGNAARRLAMPGLKSVDFVSEQMDRRGDLMSVANLSPMAKLASEMNASQKAVMANRLVDSSSSLMIAASNMSAVSTMASALKARTDTVLGVMGRMNQNTFVTQHATLLKNTSTVFDFADRTLGGSAQSRMIYALAGDIAKASAWNEKFSKITTAAGAFASMDKVMRGTIAVEPGIRGISLGLDKAGQHEHAFSALMKASKEISHFEKSNLNGLTQASRMSALKGNLYGSSLSLNDTDLLKIGLLKRLNGPSNWNKLATDFIGRHDMPLLTNHLNMLAPWSKKIEAAMNSSDLLAKLGSAPDLKWLGLNVDQLSAGNSQIIVEPQLEYYLAVFDELTVKVSSLEDELRFFRHTYGIGAVGLVGEIFKSWNRIRARAARCSDLLAAADGTPLSVILENSPRALAIFALLEEVRCELSACAVALEFLGF